MLVVAPPANLAIFGLCLEAGLLHVLAANAIFVAGFFFFKGFPAFSLQTPFATGGGLFIKLPLVSQSEEPSSSLLVFNIAGMPLESTVTSLMWAVSSLLGFSFSPCIIL